MNGEQIQGGGGKRVTAVTNTTPKRKRRPKPGDTRALRRVLWAAIRRVETILDDAEADVDITLRAVSALSTASGVYLRVIEQAELLPRLEELEEGMNAMEASVLGRAA